MIAKKYSQGEIWISNKNELITIAELLSKHGIPHYLKEILWIELNERNGVIVGGVLTPDLLKAYQEDKMDELIIKMFE